MLELKLNYVKKGATSYTAMKPDISSGNGSSSVQPKALVTWTNVYLMLLGHLRATLVKFESSNEFEPRDKHFLSRNCIWKCCL